VNDIISTWNISQLRLLKSVRQILQTKIMVGFGEPDLDRTEIGKFALRPHGPVEVSFPSM
jgi:hypothetical protein